MSVGQLVFDEVIATRPGAEELESAVRQHARFIYQLAYSILRDHQEAEDATQETYMRVCRRMKDLPQIRDQRAWLARIAWRVALGHLRKKPKQSPVEADLTSVASTGIGAEEMLVQNEQRVLLDRMIAALPRELQETLALSTVDGMTSVEISQVLGVPESTVRGRLLRARQILREKLKTVMESR
jgi:RNA polymerase sigma-70 factor, ECF subfamily